MVYLNVPSPCRIHFSQLPVVWRQLSIPIPLLKIPFMYCFRFFCNKKIKCENRWSRSRDFGMNQKCLKLAEIGLFSCRAVRTSHASA